METRTIPAIIRTISLIKFAPGTPTQYVKNTDTNEENGRNMRRNCIAKSKIEILLFRKSQTIDFSWETIENRKKFCE